MYKVFIDNKEILFTDSFKKEGGSAVEVLNWKNSSSAEVIRKRNELEAFVLLVVVDIAPEFALYACFENYQLIEASGGIVQRENEFLFIERNGLWDIPKGKIEKNEEPRDAAVREIEEECGICGPVITDFIGVTFHTYTFKEKLVLKKNWWYKLTYNGPKIGIPQTEEGITRVVWLNRNEWAIIEVYTYASIREVLRMAKEKFG